ncbi:SSI family serine proteinase inhibitor [Streptomyces sp. NPDC007088]|uniref:SSI family serine proteinase inhibitor n=1 Tax=Streptomyces sp. NPDC007088 TaxID=3364773 RepID=UPI00367614ED
MRLVTVLAAALTAAATALPAQAAPPPPPAQRPALQRPAPGGPHDTVLPGGPRAERGPEDGPWRPQGPDLPAHGLTLVVTDEAVTWVRTVSLNCAATPPDGSHPHPGRACADLAAAEGEPDRLPGTPRGCDRRWAPVTATAYGSYRGRPVNWRRTYANRCVLQSQTGAVFRF